MKLSWSATLSRDGKYYTAINKPIVNIALYNENNTIFAIRLLVVTRPIKLKLYFLMLFVLIEHKRKKIEVIKYFALKQQLKSLLALNLT